MNLNHSSLSDDHCWISFLNLSLSFLFQFPILTSSSLTHLKHNIININLVFFSLLHHLPSSSHLNMLTWNSFSKLRLYHPATGFPGGSLVKNLPANIGHAGDMGSIPGSGNFLGEWQPTPVFLPGKIPWTEEPGGLQSMGSHRVGPDWACTHQLTLHTHLENFLLFPI